MCLKSVILRILILAETSYCNAAPADTTVHPDSTYGSVVASNCKQTVFTVTATAYNKVIPSPAASSLSTQEGVNAFYASLPKLLANATRQIRGGSYHLAAEYCHAVPEPKSQPGPLQILLHGSAGYTKEYWNRGSWGNGSTKYSWTQAMNRAGYSTLAVDRLGNGESSHPDPVYDVQLQLQMETVYSLIQRIKAGTVQGIPAPLKGDLIYVGHSSGSLIGAALAQIHPSAVDAVILTGYPAAKSNNKGGVPSYHYLPAALSRPDQYPKNLNYGYLRMNSEKNRTSAFYYPGHYDPQIAHLDYETQGVQPIGEGFDLGPQIQPSFKGKVLVVTGTKDPAICGFTPVNECKFNQNILTAVMDDFSFNTGFDWYAPPSGHALNWHYSAPDTYKAVVKKLGNLLGVAAPGANGGRPTFDRLPHFDGGGP
ncbi:MAG: hypothetical protein Q9195_007880 [Heterodermia aff. obscurata]